MTQIYFGSAGRQIKSAKNWRPPSGLPAHVPFVGYRTNSEPARRPLTNVAERQRVSPRGSWPFLYEFTKWLVFFYRNEPNNGTKTYFRAGGRTAPHQTCSVTRRGRRYPILIWKTAVPFLLRIRTWGRLALAAGVRKSVQSDYSGRPVPPSADRQATNSRTALAALDQSRLVLWRETRLLLFGIGPPLAIPIPARIGKRPEGSYKKVGATIGHQDGALWSDFC